MDLESMILPERYEKMKTVLDSRTKYFSLILENLYDPHNISAILRSAEAYGIQDVHVIEDQNPFRVSKGVSMGADRWLSIHHHKNIEQCLVDLKSQGHRIFVADPKKDNPTIAQLPCDKPFSILVGREKWGVSEIAKSQADGVFQIPLYGFVESFNVSVATAIIVSHFIERLRAENIQGFFLSEEEKTILLQQWALDNHFKGSVKAFLKKSS